MFQYSPSYRNFVLKHCPCFFLNIIMVGCSAVNCSNSSEKGLRLFRFPQNPLRRKKWAVNCRRDKWEPTSTSRLCIVHFEESEFENKRDDNWKKLKPNAVPTLFNVPNPPPQNLSKRKKGIDLPKPRSILDTAEKIVSEHQVLPTNPSEGSQMEQPQSPSEQESAVDNVNETVPPTSQITEKTGAPRTTVKRKMPSTVPQPSSSKIKKVLQDPEIDFMSSVIEKLQNISNHCASQTRNEDSYDCFGKYVASMLRNIGPPTAMRLQETITSLIIDAMCPTQSPAN